MPTSEVLLDEAIPETPAESKKRIQNNKIWGSQVEAYVVDMFLQGISVLEVYNRLNEEYDFKCAYHTVAKYKKYVFDERADVATQRLVEEREKLQEANAKTEDRIIKHYENYVQYLESQIKFFDEKIVDFKQQIEAKKDKKKKAGIIALENQILKYIEKKDEARANLAKIVEGPSGQKQLTTAIVKEIAQLAVKTFAEHLPQEKKQACVNEFKMGIRTVLQRVG